MEIRTELYVDIPVLNHRTCCSYHSSEQSWESTRSIFQNKYYDTVKKISEETYQNEEHFMNRAFLIAENLNISMHFSTNDVTYEGTMVKPKLMIT